MSYSIWIIMGKQGNQYLPVLSVVSSRWIVNSIHIEYYDSI
jgi:hypothetical protein